VDHARLSLGHAEPAELLGNRQPGQAELRRQPGVQRSVVSGVGVQRASQRGGGKLIGEEAAQGVLQGAGVLAGC
jgi:hypothetical protein